MANRGKTSNVRAIFLALIFVVVIPFLPLLISLQAGWWEAWCYGIVTVLSFAVSRAVAAKKNPDLIVERSRFLRQEDAKKWDKKLAPLVGLGGGLIPAVAGIDARFGTTGTSSPIAHLFALALLVVGYGISSYALIQNKYFSGMVRIQHDRGHEVVTGGPYRMVRHPGYAGALLGYLVTPILLDSLWSFIPTAFLAIVLVVRTKLEDDTLQRELEGYGEYAKGVRFRIIPGIW